MAKFKVYYTIELNEVATHIFESNDFEVKLCSHNDEETYVKELAEFQPDAIMCRTEPITAKMMDTCKNLKVCLLYTSRPPTLAVSILKSCAACGIRCGVHGFAMNPCESLPVATAPYYREARVTIAWRQTACEIAALLRSPHCGVLR